jgi:hypothetical protein
LFRLAEQGFGMNETAVAFSTRWLDWLFVPVLLGVAWAAVRWAQADHRRASERFAAGQSRVPAWMISSPLFIVATTLVIAALGTAVGEDYWELRSFRLVFLLWTLCFVLYIVLLLLGLHRGDEGAGRPQILVGLGLTLVTLLLPALLGRTSTREVSLVSHGWFLLVAVAAGFLAAGVIKGHLYRFPRFAAGLNVLQLIGWGLTELFVARPAFPWLVRSWRLTLSTEYIDAFPMDTLWRVAGTIKVLLGAALIAVTIIDARRGRRTA